MSLAMYAAPFEDSLKDNNDTDGIISRKRQHTKTQKVYPKGNYDTEKVNSVLDKIHENPGNPDNDGDNLGDFDPPPPPVSSGVSKTITMEQMHNMSNDSNMNMFKTAGKAPQPNYNNGDDLDLNNFNSNYGDSKSAEEYYKRVLPGFNASKNPLNKQYYNPGSGAGLEPVGQDILVNKLNYMINLLEEKQDERTNNVTEEVVLYSFLGIFIIFVVDSFARAGKYVR
jgi:hypothetical protein